MRIHTKALAISSGIVFGLIVCLKTLAGMYLGYGMECLKIFQSIYPGYSISVVGSIIGLVYGFLSGAIVVGLIGWIYNRIFVRM